MVSTTAPTPSADDADIPARPPRRMVPRLAVAGVAAAMLAGGVATAPAEPSSPVPQALLEGWPVKWCGR